MHALYTLPADLAPLLEGQLDPAQLHEVEHLDLPEAQRRWAPEPELLRVGAETVAEQPHKADEVQAVIRRELQRRRDARRPRPHLA